MDRHSSGMRRKEFPFRYSKTFSISASLQISANLQATIVLPWIIVSWQVLRWWLAGLLQLGKEPQKAQPKGHRVVPGAGVSMENVFLVLTLTRMEYVFEAVGIVYKSGANRTCVYGDSIK